MENGIVKFKKGERYELNVNVGEYPYNEYFTAIVCETCVSWNGRTFNARIEQTGCGPIIVPLTRCVKSHHWLQDAEECRDWKLRGKGDGE